MLRIQNIPLPLGGGEAQLKKKAARILGVKPEAITGLSLARQSIDARKKKRRPLCLYRGCDRGRRGQSHGPVPG